MQKYYSKPVLALVFLSIISLVYIYFSLGSKSKPLFPVNINPTPTPLTQIKSPIVPLQKIKQINASYDPKIEWSNLPENLNIFKSDTTSENLDSIIEKVVIKFKLDRDTKNNNLWFSNDKSVVLAIDYKNQSFALTQSHKKSLYSKTYSLEQSMSYSKNLVDSLFPNRPPEIDKDNIGASKPTETQIEWEGISTKDGTLFNVPFVFKIEGYPYFLGANVGANLTITVGPDNTVYGIQYISQPEPNLYDSQPKKVISPDKILELLEIGQGEILGLNYLDVQPESTSLPPINITSYSIEYRLDTKTNIVLPFFRFIATFDGYSPYPTMPVTLILPAVEL